jgi:hypothetical protein
LAWIEASGFRALPPIEKPALKLAAYEANAEAEMRAIIDEDADSAALVRFNVGVRRAMTLLDLRNAGPWHLASNETHAPNQCLLRSVVVVAMRDAASPHEQPVTG